MKAPTGPARISFLASIAFLLGSSTSMACQRSADSTTYRADSSPRHTVREPVATRESLDSIFLTGNSGIEGPERVVVRDSASWVTMWGRLMTMRPVPLPLPKVEFDSSLVVVATAGSTISGHSIRIDSAAAQGGELVIYVRENIPCYRLGDMMVAYPAHAVKIRHAAETVTFVNDSTVWKCR